LRVVRERDERAEELKRVQEELRSCTTAQKETSVREQVVRDERNGCLKQLKASKDALVEEMRRNEKALAELDEANRRCQEPATTPDGEEEEGKAAGEAAERRNERSASWGPFEKLLANTMEPPPYGDFLGNWFRNCDVYKSREHFNEFEYRRCIRARKAFRKKAKGKMVCSTMTVPLGEYDFKRHRFPVTWNGWVGSPWGASRPCSEPDVGGPACDELNTADEVFMVVGQPGKALSLLGNSNHRYYVRGTRRSFYVDAGEDEAEAIRKAAEDLVLQAILRVEGQATRTVEAIPARMRKLLRFPLRQRVKLRGVTTKVMAFRIIGPGARVLYAWPRSMWSETAGGWELMERCFGHSDETDDDGSDNG